MEPRISVIVAAYRPGAGFDRVVASLDAQTLPQSEFETIVVDDGSPDDTFARISALAATRWNMRVERIENSGWPSRPRNVATQLARGEHVFFMDHDDSLYPDALRRMAEYAAETRADLLSPKESKTSDAWWGLSSLEDGNVANAVDDGGIDRLLPMVPHKLYRRTFLAEHGIRFPEGRRMLWEDIYVNVEAWRHAERVAVLADTPVYLWHSSATNNSKTYGPRDAEFWDRLDDLLAFIDRTLDGPEHAEARRSVLLHQYRSRVLTRYAQALQHASPAEARMALRRAQAIRDRYVPDEWEAALDPQSAARSLLVGAGRPDLLRRLWAFDVDTAASVKATAASWTGGALRLELEGVWTTRDGARIGLRRLGDRLVRDLPEALLQALPPAVVDLRAASDAFALELGVRDRTDQVTWAVRLDGAARYDDLGDGRVAPRFAGVAEFEPGTAASGAPLAAHPHDLVVRLTWGGAQRAGALRYAGAALPAVLHGRPAVAYRSMRGALALDLGSTLRNPAADGGLQPGPLRRSAGSVEIPLPNVHVAGDAPCAGAVRLLPAQGGTGRVLEGEVRVDGAPRLVVHVDDVADGEYEATFRTADGEWLAPRPLTADGGTLVLRTRDEAPAASPAPAPRAAGRLRRRLLDGLRGRLRGLRRRTLRLLTLRRSGAR